VVLLLGCWIFNITCGSKKKVGSSNLSEYANRVSSLVQASNALSQTWSQIQGNLVQLIATPDVLNDQLKAVEDQCKELQDEARSLDVPDEVKDTNFALRMCFEQRYRAMKNYRPDMVNAIGAGDISVYSQNISSDMQELVRSDGSYYYYKQAIGDTLSENNISDISLPDSVWVPNWDKATQASVQSMLVSLKGTEVHGMGLGAVTLTPAGQVVEQGGETIHALPSTQEVTVTINVENQGSRIEKDVVVSVSLYSTANPAPVKQDQTIASIAPGETLQVVFQGLKPKTGGVRNVLELKVAPVPLEVNLDNNQKLIYFTVE
jgi:CARDB